MPRRGAAPRRDLAADPVYDSTLVTQMINKVLHTKASEALNGTTVVNTMALERGASILRVHDVKPAMEAIEIVTFGQSMADQC